MCQKNRMINLVLFAMLFVSAVLLGAEYSWTGATGDNLYTTTGNWSENIVPADTDIIKPAKNTDVVIDLGGEERTVAALDFSSAYNTTTLKYPLFELRNGTLVLTEGFADSSGGRNDVDSGVMAENHTHPFNLVNATLKVQKKFTSGCPRSKGYLFTVGEGSKLIFDKVNLFDKFEMIKVMPGGLAEFTFDKTIQKDANSTSRSTWSNEGGIFSFPNGFTLKRTATAGWSKRASFRIQQKSGTMNLGGDVSLGNASGTESNAMGLYFQWFGGKVHALNNVNFNVDKMYQYHQTEAQFSFIEENASIIAEVDSGKRMDVSVLELREGVCLTKEGDGVLKIADVPYSLELNGGAVEFVGNTRTSMGTLKIGADCAFTLAHPNMTIETLEDNLGTITITKPGLSIAALREGATLSGAFEFEAGAFLKGDTLVTTPNAQLRAKIKADAEESFRSSGVAVVEDGDSLIVGDSTFVFNSTTITDLNNVEGWPNGIPVEGCDVTIAGEGVNVVISENLTTRWNSITVQDGAALRIASSGLSLPEIVLKGNVVLTIASDFNLTEIKTMAVGEEVPTVVVAEGVTLTVPAGYKFKDVRLVLCEGSTLTEAGDGPLVFGYANSNETTYFAMHATNATITALNSAKVEKASRIDFVSPAKGGVVKVVEDIVLKDSTITYSDRDGFAFGLNNPESENFKMIVDNTPLDIGQDTYVAGGANLVLTNNTVLFRRRSTINVHPEDIENTYSIYVQDRGRITLVDGGEIRTTVTIANATEDNGYFGKGVVSLCPSEEGFVGIEVLEGGVGCWWRTYGDNTGVIRFAGGIQKVFRGRWWGNTLGGNRSRIFNKLKGVEVAENTTMQIVGFKDDYGDNDNGLHPFYIDSPFTGSGNVIITNTWPDAKTCAPRFASPNSTCTGKIMAVACDGKAKTALYFAHGANWAGTVVANGLLKITNYEGTTENDNPASVTFGALDLQADFPVRVWRGEDGALTNDTLNVGTYLNNGGKFVPTMMTEGVEFVSNDKIVVGRIAKDAVLPDVPKNWVAITKNIDDDNENDLLILKRRKGFMIRVR